MADGCSTPNRPANQPHWKTATTAPNVASDAQQEPEGRGQRHQQRPEHERQQQEREPDHDQQVGQQRVAQLARDVDDDRRLARDPDRRCPSRP